jgi:hypothetical protein
MASDDELKKWGAGLRATFPLVGRLRRRWATKALVTHRNESTAIPLLVEALGQRDERIVGRAAMALGDLTAQAAVDALCVLWAEKRDERLGRIIAERNYIANQPIHLKALTALKCGRRLSLDRGDLVPFVVGLLADADETVRSGAKRSLEHVAPGPAQDALCDEAIKHPTGDAAKICVATGKRPSDQERACLFLFVTRQLDKYFKEDFEFQNLRLQYDRADAAVRSHVMEVVSLGDRRCAGFFGTRSKPVAECTETEIKLAIDSWQRHKDWSRLFHACLELPLRYSLPVLAQLSRSNWQPESPDLKSVYQQILADAADPARPVFKVDGNPSYLFEQWLAQGTRGELARLDQNTLRERLNTATPPEGVAIVAALAARKPLGSVAEQAVRESPHWLVRLAGREAGLIAPDLTRNTVQDFNYWITKLASSADLLNLWPEKATPADLEALSAAPPEAWTGRLGAARKVLRTIMSHRITTGTFQSMVVEAAEFAGEFVHETDVEIQTP